MRSTPPPPHSMTADDLGLIPQPRRVTVYPGHYTLPARPRVQVAAQLAGARRLLTEILGLRLGREVEFVPPTHAHDAAAHLVCQVNPSLAPGAYRLEVGAGVQIEAGALPGLLSATRTLQQLLGPPAFRAASGTGAVHLPHVEIDDAPRFDYRGVLLDVARHFMPKDAVMRFIELAAMHKLNVVHLHVTDDQGWRVEIKAFPRLTQVGAWRAQSQVGSSRSTLYDASPHGGYYTQEDLREIVAFARTRGVTIIPEIDVPGHSQAAMAAYPWLATGGRIHEVWTRWGLNPNTLGVSDEVVDFYRRVLGEVTEVFDSPIVCLGGDEVPSDQWAGDPASMGRVEQLGLAGPDDLLPWFVAQLAGHLRTLGRRASVWDEVGGARVPSDTVVLSWRDYRGGIDALRDGHDIVMCTEHQVFLNHREAPGLGEPAPVGTVHTLEDVYRFEPVNDQVAEAEGEEGTGRVLGTQAQVWTEQLDSPRRVDYAAFPRLAAFAEVAWSAPDRRDWASFVARLRGSHVARLDAAGVEYRPLDGPRPWHQRPAVPGWPLRFDELGNLVHSPTGDR